MSNDARRGKRLFAGFLAAVMALSVAPVLGFTGVAGADGHLEAADPIGEGNFCEDVPMQEPFTDVQTTDPSYEEIVCLVATQVTTGVTATTYEPNSFVTRRQMALFLTRVAAEADRLEIDDNINELPEPAANEFPDVEDEEQFIQDAISQLAQAEIAEGFADGNYRPAAPVSRRQMAAFIDRLYEYLTGEALPRATEDNFEDDNEDSAEAQSSTNAVAEAGIFIGNTDGTFAPAQEITRRQMANVLTRTFEVLFENGEIDQWAAEGTSNQDFVVAPAADQSKTASTVGGNQARTTFTVTGLDDTQRYDIALFNCADVTNDNGVVSFRDDENTDADADLEGNNVADNANPTTAAAIENVNNGAAVVDQIVPVNGTITFTVDSEEADCVVAVLFQDTADDDVINLNADNEPVEPFVATGELTFTARPAVTGSTTGNTVTSTDEANDRFTADSDDAGTFPDVVFAYDANDSFNLPGLSGASLAQFEDALTVGDVVSVQYNADPAGVSTFTITTNTTPAPSNVTASVTNADGDATANDVVITFTAAPDAPAGSTYTVTRYVVAPNIDGTCPAATSGNTSGPVTVVDTTNTDTTARDDDVTAGCYAYTVTATSPNSGAASTESAFSNTVRVLAPLAADTTAPVLASAAANDVNNGVGSTNQVRFTFTEASGTIVVLDATKFTVTQGAITYTGTSATVSGTTAIVTVDGTLDDATTDVTYTAAAAAGAVEDASGNDNTAGTVNFAY